MPIFNYETLDHTGEKVRGTIEASDQEAACQNLLQRYFVVSKIFICDETDHQVNGWLRNIMGEMKRLLLIMLGLLCISASVWVFARAFGIHNTEAEEFVRRNKDAHMFPDKLITPVTMTLNYVAVLIGLIGLILLGVGTFGSYQHPNTQSGEPRPK